MQGLVLIVIAILLMVALNILMIVATVGVKALRIYKKNRVKKLRDRLEPVLYDYLATGEISPILGQLKGSNFDVLSKLIIELLAVLRGSQHEQVVGLSGELGLVERDLRKLDSRNRWQRARGAENLGYYGGQQSVAPLAALLSDADETLRAVAARALSRIGTQEAAEILADHLSSSSELTGLRMAENLERIGQLAIKPLTELIEGEEEEVRQGQVLAARVLGNLRVSEARGTLCRAIRRHWNTDLRAQATLALGKIGDPDDVPDILEAARDNSWPVRVQAANALEMIGDTSAVPVLEDLATDEEWWVRLNASRALSKMGAEGERALARLLESEDRYARDRAAATLQERGIVRHIVEDLTETGERAESARRVVRAMIRNGATRYLQRLSRELPAEDQRRALRDTMAEMKVATNEP